MYLNHSKWVFQTIVQLIKCKYNLQIRRAIVGLMLQDPASIQKNVQRSLNRLQLFSKGNNLGDIIPSLYYSADLLMKYASTTNTDDVNYQYFREFKGELQNFVTKDLSGMVTVSFIKKQHQREILDEMLGIVNSDIFTECLKPEMRSSKIHFDEDGKKTKKANNGHQGINFLPDTTSIDGMHPDLKQKPVNFKKQSSSTETELGQKLKQHQILYANLLTAYKQHRIDEAQALKKQYIKNKYPLNAQQTNLFKTIDLQYNTMISFYKQFDLEGWIFDKTQNGVTLQYKIFQAEKQIAIRISSQFDVSIQNFLAILNEIDLMGAYIPFTYDTKQLKVISRNQKIGTSKIYIPCLTDRETYFYAAGYDRMKENGSVFLFSKTINQDKLYQQKYGFKVPDQSDYVRLQYIFFIVQYIPITKTRAKVRLASKVDMKLNFLPQFIINMSARKFAFDYFKNIIKMNKNFKGSPWQKKIKQNPQFYGFFKSKVEQYMGQK